MAVEVLGVCGLCGHVMTLDRCGLGGTTDDATGRDQILLCHADDHDCYHRWTVYGDRPVQPETEAGDG